MERVYGASLNGQAGASPPLNLSEIADELTKYAARNAKEANRALAARCILMEQQPIADSYPANILELAAYEIRAERKRRARGVV